MELYWAMKVLHSLYITRLDHNKNKQMSVVQKYLYDLEWKEHYIELKANREVRGPLLSHE